MYNASHRIADITISRLLGTPIIPAVPLTFGQMWSQPMISSAHLDSTAPAPYRNSLVVVGNPIYLLINNAVCLIPTSIIIIYWSVACMHIPFRKQFFRFCSCDRSISLYFAKCMHECAFLFRYYCRKGSTSQTSKPPSLIGLFTKFGALIISSTTPFVSRQARPKIPSALTAGCYKKSSCPPNSATQDITIFGALLVVTYTTLLSLLQCCC